MCRLNIAMEMIHSLIFMLHCLSLLDELCLSYTNQFATFSPVPKPIQQFHVLPTLCVEVFCVDLRTDREYFPLLQ